MQDGRPVPTHEDGSPASLEILATAPARLWSQEEQPTRYAHEPGELEHVATALFGDASPEHVEQVADNHAVMAAFTRPGGGTVFNAGVIDWTFGLKHRDPVVDRITRNVLDRLADPGPMPERPTPAGAGWRADERSKGRRVRVRRLGDAQPRALILSSARRVGAAPARRRPERRDHEPRSSDLRRSGEPVVRSLLRNVPRRRRSPAQAGRSDIGLRAGPRRASMPAAVPRQERVRSRWATQRAGLADHGARGRHGRLDPRAGDDPDLVPDPPERSMQAREAGPGRAAGRGRLPHGPRARELLGIRANVRAPGSPVRSVGLLDPPVAPVSRVGLVRDLSPADGSDELSIRPEAARDTTSPRMGTSGPRPTGRRDRTRGPTSPGCCPTPA